MRMIKEIDVAYRKAKLFGRLEQIESVIKILEWDARETRDKIKVLEKELK